MRVEANESSPHGGAQRSAKKACDLAWGRGYVPCCRSPKANAWGAKKKMNHHQHVVVLSFAAVGAIGGCVMSDPEEVSTVASALLSGAIFTTTADGSHVNANIYGAKE